MRNLEKLWEELNQKRLDREFEKVPVTDVNKGITQEQKLVVVLRRKNSCYEKDTTYLAKPSDRPKAKPNKGRDLKEWYLVIIDGNPCSFTWKKRPKKKRADMTSKVRKVKKSPLVKAYLKQERKAKKNAKSENLFLSAISELSKERL